MKIKNISINKDTKTFIIAELSANHNQNYEVAVESIYAAKEAGADAIKLQTYTPDTITINCENEYFKIRQGTIWDGKYLYDLYKEAFTPWEWHPKLKAIAESLGMVFFSSPFDKSAVDFLESIDVPAYKIASFEITDIPLMEYVASKGKPIILATGVATLSDIEGAVNACRKMGNNQIIILKCTSSYPAPLADINLKTIPNIADTFNCLAGLSDHTLGISVPIAAVALGAKVIEKHFILDKKIGGPDSQFSLDKMEFAQMVKSIRDVEKALGHITYELTEKQINSKEHSRSLFIVQDLNEGDILNEDNVRSIRPGFGLPPKYLHEILGKQISRSVTKGTPLAWDLVK